MRRRHHFHIDHLGHSVSVTVQTGHKPVVEVLVDGKETGYVTAKDDGPLMVAVELPTDPPTSVTVRVTPGPGVPRCLLLAAPDGEGQVMAPRPY
ncbi:MULTISPECIES: hypothetical protein [Streptomyces]|uniref:Uncharacterized protein n=1 Tax=Streptomyces venezuelae (strain ATCC 10712 / CBS 650.69 / DSM 40230 / JCM 4526 / NBRC 13096 / PD 04745) TaxID=953739 RepID=F2RAG5_STRVP|nr:hypothetical protein [Streptomyces venezuelae]APE22463.1 hypothetical protein vnz_16560 [Streptomyces venezuelae]QER99845.1 hypothetical protein DEJ43_16770 [Streptomyces venezuelae ATCC 10712]CCA56647.1 hypothetical protein SVEN_3361 [Streptomyces venezuelae ATCC 10712]